jgi:carbonic anhydrase
LLPPEKTLYRYSGSLTTPDCSEGDDDEGDGYGVLWSVMNTPVQMSAAQIAAFTDIFPNNSRPLQPLQDQEVIVNDTP